MCFWNFICKDWANIWEKIIKFICRDITISNKVIINFYFSNGLAVNMIASQCNIFNNIPGLFLLTNANLNLLA